VTFKPEPFGPGFARLGIVRFYVTGGSMPGTAEIEAQLQAGRVTPSMSLLSPARQLLPSVLQDPSITSKLKPIENGRGHRLLAYFIPIDYIMQGMIANTGGEWKLFEQHKTLGMITEYIFHPFSHLAGDHSHHAGMQAHHPSMHDSPGMKRRIVFIEISANHAELKSLFDDFNINAKRTPIFFVDVHLHTGEILRVKDAPSGSGWGTVPTPCFRGI